MTCIIGFKSNGVIYMAADSAATSDDGDVRPIVAEKIIRNGEYLIGFAGSIRAGQIASSKWFSDPPDNIEEFVESLRLLMEELGCLVTTEVSTSMSQSCFLIAHKGELYEILMDFAVNKVEGDFTTIGSGAPYALAAMDAIQDQDLSPSEKLIKALTIATKYNVTVREPYVIEKY